jgi:hypothetical protein
MQKAQENGKNEFATHASRLREASRSAPSLLAFLLTTFQTTVTAASF